MTDDLPPIFDWLAKPKLPIQRYQRPAAVRQLPPPEPEMRNRLAGASDLDSKLPRVFPATANAVGTGIGWVIGAVIMGALALIFLAPFMGFLVIVLITVPGPILLGALILWLVCSAFDWSVRLSVREELERQEKRKNLKK